MKETRAPRLPERDGHVNWDELYWLMRTNRDIGKLLREIGAFLEMEGVNFKPRAYEKAALAIESMEEPVASLQQKGGAKLVATVPGVGKSIAEKIVEFLETGRVDYLEVCLDCAGVAHRGGVPRSGRISTTRRCPGVGRWGLVHGPRLGRARMAQPGHR